MKYPRYKHVVTQNMISLHHQGTPTQHKHKEVIIHKAPGHKEIPRAIKFNTQLHLAPSKNRSINIVEESAKRCIKAGGISRQESSSIRAGTAEKETASTPHSKRSMKLMKSEADE